MLSKAKKRTRVKKRKHHQLCPPNLNCIITVIDMAMTLRKQRLRTACLDADRKANNKIPQGLWSPTGIQVRP